MLAQAGSLHSWEFVRNLVPAESAGTLLGCDPGTTGDA